MAKPVSTQQSDSMTSPVLPEQRPGSPSWWLWGISGFLVVLALGGMLWFGTGRWPTQAAEDLQHFGSVPEFTLLERSGQTVTAGTLRGKVWVANFIYTRCLLECPLMSNTMAQLQGLVADAVDVRLVSITVDPEYDTPEVLRRYAQSFAAHPQRWLFLTGDKEVIYRLAQEGFHLGVEEPHEQRKTSLPRSRQWWAQELVAWFTPPVAWAHHGAHPTAPGSTVLHSARIVLVDRQATIRQYYDGTAPESVRRLSLGIRRVLQER